MSVIIALLMLSVVDRRPNDRRPLTVVVRVVAIMLQRVSQRGSDGKPEAGCIVALRGDRYDEGSPIRRSIADIFSVDFFGCLDLPLLQGAELTSCKKCRHR